MKENGYLEGMLAEINTQISSLITRKEKLLAKPGTQDVLAEPETGSYGRYLKLLSRKREPVLNPKVVYQGEPGAFSEMAAMDFFGEDVNVKGLHQFEDTFLALKNGDADYAVLPIENSSTGAIRQVYDLLEEYHFFFVGETTVKVNQNLMALPGTKLSDITTVYSHEQGLFQSEAFLNDHPEWRTVAQADTAGSARMVAERKDSRLAAICSSRAAEIYGLEILAEAINGNQSNTTRFVVISPVPELREERNKICIALTTAHHAGALHSVLSVFTAHGVNLLRLESRPIPEHNWEYMFFIEFTGDLITKNMDSVIHEISILSSDLWVLGNFKGNL